MWRAWSLRRRIFLFFALIACGGLGGLAAGVWAGYASLKDPAALSAFLLTGLIAGAVLTALVVWVWLMFDENVAQPLDALSGDLRARAHAGVADPVATSAAQYLGDIAPAAAAVSERLSDARAALAEAVARETKLISRQNAFLARALRDVPAGVIICSNDHHIALYNARAAEVFDHADLLGLARSIFDLLSPEPIRHAFGRLSAAPDEDRAADLLCPSVDGRVILKAQMRLAPSMDDAAGAAGYILTLRDVTQSLRSAATLHQTLRESLEKARRPAANLQTVAAAMTGAQGLSEEQSALFKNALATETEALSGAISDLSAAYEALTPEWWPLDDVAVNDLTTVVKARFPEAFLDVAPIDPPLEIRCDGLSMAHLLGDAAVFLQQQGASRTTLRAVQEPPGARIELIAHDCALSVAAVETWLTQPLEASPFGHTAQDVLVRHGTEIWPETPARGPARLCLPIRSARPLNDRGGAFARSEFYDFSLLEAGAARGASDQTPLCDLQFVVFDTETTGLEPHKGDELVQIAAVRVVSQRILSGETLDTFVNPGRKIPPSSTRIHGVTDAMVADAPSVREAVARFHRFCGDSVLVAHHAPFDMTFMRRTAPSIGVEFNHPVLDTALLSAIVYGSYVEHTLDALCERLGVEIPPEVRHTALGDSIATAQALLKLIPMVTQSGPTTLGATIQAVRKYSSYANLAVSSAPERRKLFLLTALHSLKRFHNAKHSKDRHMPVPVKLFYAMTHRKDPSRRTPDHWGNFGDELSPIVVERVFGRPAVYADPRKCEMIAVGSLLDKFSFNRVSQILQYQRWAPRPLTVWGSGFMLENSRLIRSGLRVLAARGPLTRDKLPEKLRPSALGDPGVFADEILEAPATEKRWAVGLLPHYVDRGDPRVAALAAQTPNSRVINVMARPDLVIRDIAACDFVLSSSLHGLIAADSLGVPNRWMRLSDKVAGGEFKFHDYCAALGKDLPPAYVPDTAAPGLDGRAVADLAEPWRRGDVDAAKSALRRAAQGL